MAIDWKTEKNETQLEQVSPDGRWHFGGRTAAGEKPRLSLTNYDLLCAPCGFGETEAECWRKYIACCDEYAARLAKAKAEAERHLDELTANA